jgi:hypothetical protein
MYSRTAYYILTYYIHTPRGGMLLSTTAQYLFIMHIPDIHILYRSIHYSSTLSIDVVYIESALSNSPVHFDNSNDLRQNTLHAFLGILYVCSEGMW